MDFSEILRAVLTPVALISGLGLLLLSQVNRFNQALARLRELLRIRDQPHPVDQIEILYKRCHTLQRAIGSMVLALLFIVFLIFLQALDAAGLAVLDGIKLFIMLLVFASVTLSLGFFLLDVKYSLAAIRIEIEFVQSELGAAG